MKKRFIGALLAMAMISGLLVGCGGDEASSGTTSGGDAALEESEELPVLRVACQPFFVSAQIGYIMDNKLDEASGFKIEPVMFSSGAPINEALSTDSFDIAPTGGAYIFGVANFNAKLIGAHINGSGGNEVWVKADSDMAAVKGAVADYPEVLGDAASVEGSKILQTTGTTSQYTVVKWLEAIGAEDATVETVHMDFPQVFNAFVSNQGDVAGLVSPYCFQTDDTMVRAATLDDLGIQVYEEIIIPNAVYEDDSKKELISSFLKVLYSVGDEFEADPEKKFEAVYKWYQDNGSTATEEDVRAECELKTYVTTEEAKAMELGVIETDYAEFMASQDKLDETGLENFKNNIAPDYLKDALQ